MKLTTTANLEKHIPQGCRFPTWLCISESKNHEQEPEWSGRMSESNYPLFIFRKQETELI